MFQIKAETSLKGKTKTNYIKVNVSIFNYHFKRRKVACTLMEAQNISFLDRLFVTVFTLFISLIISCLSHLGGNT